MKINPREISWSRVTERMDGSAIPGEVNYSVGVAGADGSVIHLMTLVGELQPDDRYVAQIADMSLEPGDYTLALAATEVDTGLTSAWSNTASFSIVTAEPRPPQAVAVI